MVIWNWYNHKIMKMLIVSFVNCNFSFQDDKQYNLVVEVIKNDSLRQDERGRYIYYLN